MKALVAIFAVVGTAGIVAVAVLSGSESDNGVTGGSTHAVVRRELVVTVTEQGTLESSENLEIKCLVRGDNTITSVVESGTHAKAGDTLVQLETLALDEEISERTKFYHLAESQVARSGANVARAKLAIQEYEQGQFVSALASLEKELAVAESRLLNATNRRRHSEMLRRSDYASELEVEEKIFAVKQAELNVKLTKTQIDVLRNFTRKEQLVRLNGELSAAEASHEADVERAYADKKRLDRAVEELAFCTIKADRDGMVIYPTGEEWKNAPEIEEGATVHKNQVLLLMPDLKEMQVKVGVHESMVDRVRKGMTANVTLNRTKIVGKVSSVARVAKPAGWWTGNVVKYDVIVEIPETAGLKPGMTVEVELVIARHQDALVIPAAAVLETSGGYCCWVRSGDSVKRRPVKLGDSNEMFIMVEDGLTEGEQVVIDPLANVSEAQAEAAQLLNQPGTQSPAYSDI